MILFQHHRWSVQQDGSSRCVLCGIPKDEFSERQECPIKIRAAVGGVRGGSVADEDFWILRVRAPDPVAGEVANRIHFIKWWRDLAGAGLKEAKTLSDRLIKGEEILVDLPAGAAREVLSEQNTYHITAEVDIVLDPPSPPTECSEEARRILEALRKHPELMKELAEWLSWEALPGHTVSDPG